MTGKTGRFLLTAALPYPVAVYRLFREIGAMAVDAAWHPDRLVAR